CVSSGRRRAGVRGRSAAQLLLGWLGERGGGCWVLGSNARAELSSGWRVIRSPYHSNQGQCCQAGNGGEPPRPSTFGADRALTERRRRGRIVGQRWVRPRRATPSATRASAPGPSGLLARAVRARCLLGRLRRAGQL